MVAAVNITRLYSCFRSKFPAFCGFIARLWYTDKNEMAAEALPAPAAAVVATPISGVRPPIALCLEAALMENWRSFKHKWRFYAFITNLDRQTAKHQVALLLHIMDDQVLKVCNDYRRCHTYRRRNNTEVWCVWVERNIQAIAYIQQTQPQWIQVRHLKISCWPQNDD